MAIKLSLTRISGMAFFLVFSAVLIAALGAYWLASSIIQNNNSNAAIRVADNTAANVANLIGYYHSALAQVATQPDIIAALNAGNASTIANKLISLFPGALAVHIVTSATAANDSDLATDYASMELLRRAEKHAVIPDAEFHMADTPAAHIELWQGVPGNNNPAGYIILNLKPTLLQATLTHGANAAAYLELRQYQSNDQFQVLAKSGDLSASKTAAAPILAPIKNTAWKVAFWPKDNTGDFSWNNNRLAGLCFFLALILFVSAPVLLYRNLTRHLRHDIHTITDLLNDIRAGALTASYPMHLSEFKSLADNLTVSGKKLIEDQNALWQVAQTDPLTALATQPGFEIRIRQLFAQTRMGFPSSVILIDIDHLREINNTLGHDAGDRVIKQFGQALKKALRQSDFVARIGGNRFGAIFAFTDMSTAINLAERLRKQIPQEFTVNKDVTQPVSWSGGLAIMDANDPSAGLIVKRAAELLQQAQQAGRGRTMVQIVANAGPELPPPAR